MFWIQNFEESKRSHRQKVLINIFYPYFWYLCKRLPSALQLQETLSVLLLLLYLKSESAQDIATFWNLEWKFNSYLCNPDLFLIFGTISWTQKIERLEFAILLSAALLPKMIGKCIYVKDRLTHLVCYTLTHVATAESPRSIKDWGFEGRPKVSVHLYLIIISIFRKDLGDGGLMSQGREAELPVTTDMNVPFTPGWKLFITRVAKIFMKWSIVIWMFRSLLDRNFLLQGLQRYSWNGK